MSTIVKNFIILKVLKDHLSFFFLVKYLILIALISFYNCSILLV